MTVSITPEQIARIQRATSEEFAFRLVRVNGEAVVRVHSPKSGNEYSVRGAECDCKDAEFHPETCCKHTIAANLWLQSQAAPAPAAPAVPTPSRNAEDARREHARRIIERDFPDA